MDNARKESFNVSPGSRTSAACCSHMGDALFAKSALEGRYFPRNRPANCASKRLEQFTSNGNDRLFQVDFSVFCDRTTSEPLLAASDVLDVSEDDEEPVDRGGLASSSLVLLC